MKAQVSSSIDVALFLREIARNQQQSLSLSRMQWLLFIAQHQYAVESRQRMLMPAVFVLVRSRPIETNVQRCFAQGQVQLGSARVNEDIRVFLQDLFHFHQHRSDQAIQQGFLAQRDYQRLISIGEGGVIPFDQICAMKRVSWSVATVSQGEPSHQSVSQQLVRAKTNKTAAQPVQVLPDGRTVMAWKPKVSQPDKHFRIETIGRQKKRKNQLQKNNKV